jgi:hypothetical protein
MHDPGFTVAFRYFLCRLGLPAHSGASEHISAKDSSINMGSRYMPSRNNVIAVHSENPHYYLYNGSPLVLITSAEQYGAVVNSVFDYERYLKTLHAYDLNYTRIYPGVMFEPENKWIAANNLGVNAANLLVPWARSSKHKDGGKYDLENWDQVYFNRLHDFVYAAAELGIIVEVCLFNAQYEDSWPLSPLYYRNNIQGETDCDHRDAQTLKHAGLTRRYDAYVRKVVHELNPFGNVILEICDEPLINGTPPGDAIQWLQHILDVIVAEEAGLPNKHLIAQEIEGLVDFSENAGISVLVTQYVWGPDDGQMGGMRALDCKYHLNKPIDFNETNFFPLWYIGDRVADSRVEAWEFIIGGGSSFNQLNGTFTVANPSGDSPENRRVLNGLKVLSGFINSFDFIKMKQDKTSVRGGVPAGFFHRLISEPGQQYALYLHRSQYDNNNWRMGYTVVPGEYALSVIMALPDGCYRSDWIEPETDKVLASSEFTHHGPSRIVDSPVFNIDIALRIRRISLC